MSVTEFKQRYFDSLLNFLWRQWSRLGINGQIANGNSDNVCDPEALLIFSSYFGRYDSRLYDLIIEWLSSNGALINIPRLKALLEKMKWSDRPSLGVILHYAGRDSKNSRFIKLAKSFQIDDNTSPVPLFTKIDGSRNDFIRQQDDLALAYGYLRNPYEASHKVSALPAGTAATLLFKLRGAFGLSSRAEVILHLLCRNGVTIQEIADSSGFAWKSIQDALKDLKISGLVSSVKSSKRGESYYLPEPQKLLTLFHAEHILFPQWYIIYDTLTAIWETTKNPLLEKVSEQTFYGSIRQCFQREIGNRLLNANLPELQLLSPETIETLPIILDSL